MGEGILGIILQYTSAKTLIVAVLSTCVVLAVSFFLYARGNAKARQDRERQEKKQKEEQERLKKQNKLKKKEDKKNKPKPPKPSKEQESPLFVTSIKGHEDEVTAIAFNPNGSFLASFSKDRTLRLFFTSNLKELQHQRINLDLDFGERASFSSDGRYLLTVMNDTKNVRIYELRKAKDKKNKYETKVAKEFSTPHKAELNTLVMASNSKFLLSCSDDTTLILWGIPSANILENMTVKKGGNHMAALSPDSKYFTLATATGEVVIWEVVTKKGENWEFSQTKKVAVLPNGHRTSVNAVCFSQDGRFLATGSKDCTWRLWDVNVRYALSEDPRCMHTVKLEYPVDNLSFAPDGSVILVLSRGDLHVYDTKTANELAVIRSPHGGKTLTNITWAPDSAYFATAAAQDRVIKLWRIPTK